MGFKTWLGEKVILPVAAKVAATYVEKTLLTPKKRFRKRKGRLSLHESKTLAMLQGVGIRPGSTRAATDQALREMTQSISNLLRRDITADQRRFGINFLSYYTNEMTLQEMMTALRGIDARILAAIVKAVGAELMEDPAVKLISTRDALGGIMEATEDECRSAFKVADLLHEYLGHQNDLNGYKSGPVLGEELVWGGIDSPIAQGSCDFAEMRSVQRDMKSIGRQTARQKCSRTHIVMSVAIGDAWKTGGDSEQKWIVITAAKTDKSDLLIPSQTPVVHKKDGKWMYYGDVSGRPSSELASHWLMHERLTHAGEAWAGYKCIFHAHLVDLIELSAAHGEESAIQIGKRSVPNIDWFPHGTADLGGLIIDAMVGADVPMAVVKKHGPWFVCSNLADGYREALAAVHDAQAQESRC